MRHDLPQNPPPCKGCQKKKRKAVFVETPKQMAKWFTRGTNAARRYLPKRSDKDVT